MQYFIVTSTVIDIYSEPRFTSAVVTQSLFGESNFILSERENWFKIRLWDGYEGWAHGFYGFRSDSQYDSNLLTTNLYDIIRNEKGNIIKQLVFGSSVKIDDDKIILPDESIGYFKRSKPEVQVQGTTRDKIIGQAQKFLGIPYKWGGRSSFGLDCSGLVQTVFRAVGLDIPRDSYQQSDFLGEKTVEINFLDKGDLIFFADGSKITHVAISLGGPNFIHSQGEVKINSLSIESNNFSKKLSEMNVSGKSINSMLIK